MFRESSQSGPSERAIREHLRSLLPLLSGLRLLPKDWNAAAKTIFASIAGVTLFILILDGILFRRSLPADYVAFYTSALIPRVIVVAILASLEEVKFRLLLMTAAVMIASSLWRRPLPPLAFIAIILACQFANVGGLVVADPLYSSLRYWAVGSVWGLLYWRHGWAAALIGHAATHFILDPLLMVVLLHS